MAFRTPHLNPADVLQNFLFFSFFTKEKKKKLRNKQRERVKFSLSFLPPIFTSGCSFLLAFFSCCLAMLSAIQSQVEKLEFIKKI